MNANTASNEKWWTTLSDGEKDLIRALMEMVKGAKHSEVVEVARAARKWERGLTFFFKSRLKNQRTRTIYLHSPSIRAAVAAAINRRASFPSNVRNPRDVFPNPD